MANTIGTPTYVHGRAQFEGFFSDMWRFTATISDQDAISATLTAGFALTIPGVALGDLCLVAMDNNLIDADSAVVILQGVVTAANTVTIRVTAGAAYNADDVNGATVKGVVLRPAWA